LTDPERQASEPAFNAPWPSLVLPAVLIAAFMVQFWVLPGEVAARLALTSQAVLREGRWETLFTHIFLHGGWTHLFMNVGSALAFGPPVARLLGQGGRGAILFLVFFLICGAFGGLGYVVTHIEGSGLVVGASGAISGLWGAASRLLGQNGRLAPIFGRQVVTQAVVFAVLNVLIGLAGGFAQLNIAWEAHLAGYVAGLFLIGPASLLADRSRGRELPSG
jgi:membrane associated rhomboid family serine protease